MSMNRRQMRREIVAQRSQLHDLKRWLKEAQESLADFQWGPDRIRAESASKLAIIDEHAAEDGYCRRCVDGEWHDSGVSGVLVTYPASIQAPCPTVRLLAVPYADHIDFDPDWVIPRR